MAQCKNIESLPMELLGTILSHVDDHESIKQARLVSRSFNGAASPYLLTNASVCTSSESLSKLEELSGHAVFRRSITHVIIVLSQYDVGLANNRSIFFRDCETNLIQHMETIDRTRDLRYYMRRHNRVEAGDGSEDEDEEEEIQHQVENQLFEVSVNQEILNILLDDFDEKSATLHQRLAMRLHIMYKRLCDDQEEVRRGNKHIKRICSALLKLPNLTHLKFRDDPYHFRSELQESDFSDLGFQRSTLQHFDSVLRPSKWCGSHTTAYTMAPPVEMLGELCALLGEGGLRPRSIETMLNAPADLRTLALPPDQKSGLQMLVSRATALKLVVNGWARIDSHAVDNNRPEDEMLALCSFTRPFFSAPNLKDLYIFFAEFPAFHETPQVTLHNILPMETAWPQLRRMDLRYQPSTIDDLRALVELQKDTITKFHWECGWLLSGTWEQAVDVLRGFNIIKQVTTKYPRGERYGDGRSFYSEMPYDAVYSYILKLTDVNPLRSNGEATLQQLATSII